MSNVTECRVIQMPVPISCISIYRELLIYNLP